jgi:transcriptional regulator with GAF, ATPase, and Fis domain
MDTVCHTVSRMSGRPAVDGSDSARLRRLEALDELLATIRDALDIRDVFVRISEIAQRVLPHDCMGLPLVDADGEHAVVHAVTAVVIPDVPGRVRLPDPGIVTREWDFVIVDDMRLDPIEKNLAPARAGYRSLLRLPLRQHGRFLGALDFFSLTPSFYRQEDVLVGRRIADHVVLALSHHRLAEEQRKNDELRARASNLALLDELLAAVTGSGDLPDVWDRISSAARQVLPHDALLLAALLPDRATGRVYASKTPDSAKFAEFVTVPPAVVNNPGWDVDLVEDLQARPDQQHLESTKLGYRAALRVPLRLDGEFVAALSFLSFTPNVYGESEVALARHIASRMLQSFARERRIALHQQATEATARAARLEARVRTLTEELDAHSGYRRVVGQAARWRQALVQATQVAATDTTVLLLGESGTGKEVVARFVHRASARKDGSYVALNCAALPDHLLEAELFGYERGAFTGAVQSKPGQLEQASGGTLFLDEVGEMSLPAQAKFLRVLQEREFQRLGGTRVLRTDARIIAATNRDLGRAIALGQFREDLFYRLNVFAIQLPALRDRREDILPLADAFLQEIARGLGRPPAGISRDARDQLTSYHWPGNVRELRNILERAAILADGGLITSEQLALIPPPSTVPPAASTTPGAPTDISSMERTMVEDAMKDARYNKSKAAKALGLTRAQLYVRLKRYGME